MRVKTFIWLTRFPYPSARLHEKNPVKSVKRILKLLPTKGILQLVNPGTSDINFTWQLLSEEYFPAWN
jgi:hypothetical protein